MAEEPVVVANRYPYLLAVRRQAVLCCRLLRLFAGPAPRYRCTPDPSFRLVDLARTPLRRLRHYKGKPDRTRPGVDSCGAESSFKARGVCRMDSRFRGNDG